MYEFMKLFTKINIGNMELKNRICFGEQAPQAASGIVTQANEDFYAARAAGGCGLVMTGAICVDISGLGTESMARLDDDKYIPGLAKLAKRIHESSAEVKAGVQICHEGRAMRPDAAGASQNIRPVAPSPVKFKWGVVPRELSIEEIIYLENQFIEAARRVKDAGFDCVEVHGAHGYLVHAFMSPYTNRRKDIYGGSIENNTRFACNIIRGIKKKCGEDFPVLIKINAFDQIETEEEQLTIDISKAIAPYLEKAGADEIHITGRTGESAWYSSVGPYFVPKAVFADYAAEIKRMVNIPVGVINRISDPIVADQLLVDGKADTIWMLRALITDPELPIKAAEGRLDEIRRCISCNTCHDILFQGWFHETRCTLNPDAWREGVSHIEPSLRTKKVLVVGGGPAGMEAARISALIGHDVYLWEKDSELGGQLRPGAVPPGKSDILHIITYYNSQLKKLGVKVELGKEANQGSVKELKPDVIIIATGSHTFYPQIPGIDKKIVVDARKVLDGTSKVGSNVVIIGGGEVGIETAEMLSAQGKKVTILEMLPEVGILMVRDVIEYVIDQIIKHHGDILTEVKVEEITDDSVIFITKEMEKVSLKADSVIIAAGSKPNNDALDVLQSLAKEVYMAGDCLVPSNIRMAIHQGNIIGRMLY